MYNSRGTARATASSPLMMRCRPRPSPQPPPPPADPGGQDALLNPAILPSPPPNVRRVCKDLSSFLLLHVGVSPTPSPRVLDPCGASIPWNRYKPHHDLSTSRKLPTHSRSNSLHGRDSVQSTRFNTSSDSLLLQIRLRKIHLCFRGLCSVSKPASSDSSGNRGNHKISTTGRLNLSLVPRAAGGRTPLQSAPTDQTNQLSP